MEVIEVDLVVCLLGLVTLGSFGNWASICFGHVSGNPGFWFGI